jgi:UPF0755 protein
MDKRVIRRRRLAASAVILIFVGFLGFGFRSQIRSGIEGLLGNDFAGPGHGSTTITVADGESGASVIDNLVVAHVIKNSRLATKLASEQHIVFYPGSFTLKLEMRALDALNYVGNPDNALKVRVTIKEGLRLSNVFAALTKATGIPTSEFQNAASDVSAFQVGNGAPSLEGYLFPATYDLDPHATAKSILLKMNQRMVDELSSFGVSKANWHRVLTLAGLVQAEARRTEDFYKVSRTFLNRIDKGMHLQSDATVSYGVNGKTVNTTAADRANDNGYNTYLHAGLPIGPISAPGHVAIDAALHPASGKWLYFCAVNLETGETWFSETYAEHEKAVAVWRQWMKDHPGYE